MSIPGYAIVETVHESARRVIYRATRESDGEQVVLKTLLAQYPRRREVAELRREFHIARKVQLDGVIAVYSLLTYGAGNVAIEMEPFGLSLADFLAQRDGAPLGLGRFYDVAIRLAAILGRVHERDVVHKDVVPRNVLIDPATGDLRLIDFGISSELSRERQSTTLARRLEGSLPYISPEQTGRMNRDVDYRSDYYSLGVTYFELLTGTLPLTAGTALEWVHQHISQKPRTAREVNPDAPEALSNVIARLMSKGVEDRYQSTYGLIADLERCRDAGGTAGVFALGRDDISRRFQIPQNLYGRESELEQLTGMFDDVAHGGTGLCLVAGEAGVGKSALVNELSKSIVGKQGYLVQGKFDQLHKSSAYAAFAAAFRDLVRQLLGESDARLEIWRDQLREALGPSGALIVDLVPDLELIVGAQPPVPDLPPAEAQNRFQHVFARFVEVFATAEHPLVVFIDDLHWSDVPTLSLIQRLITARELGHLFLIGAYRENEVHAGHPLRTALTEIEKTREIVALDLRPLDRAAVARLVSDTLRTAPERAAPLAELVFERTQGNPFFINALLDELHERGAIAFVPDTGRWEWDLDEASRAEMSDDVVDLVVSNLRRLPDDTQHALQLAACIGNRFDLRTLSIIHEQPMHRTGAALHEALKRNMIVPLSDSYTLVGLESSAAPDAPGATEIDPAYKFQHDRVQQAAYALIDDDRKQAVHLSIGRLIERHCTESERDERLVDIVRHLDAGRNLIDSADERHALARMNVDAALKAQRSSAYESALEFLTVGRELLPADPWSADYELMLSLATESQRCAYLTGDYAGADRWTDAMLERARTPLEKAEILSARTRQYATIGKMRESIDAAIAGLSLLGIELTADPGPDAIAAEVAAVDRNLAGRRIADLIDAPAMTAPTEQVAIGLLMEIFPAAFLSGSGDLFPYLVLKSVNLSLAHGTSPESAFAYAAYGMLLCGALGDPALGYEYGRLAVAMNDKLADIALKSRVIYVYTMFVHHWTEHWSSMTPWFRRGIEAGYQSGDLLYLAYSAQDCIIWDPRLDLDTASSQQREYLRIVADCEYQDSLDSGTLFLQMQLNFQGLTDARYSLSDESFDERACLAGMRERHFMTGVANYHIYKAEIHYLYGDCEGALEHVTAMDQMIASAMSLPQLVRHHIIAFLTRSRLARDMQGDQREAALERLRDGVRQMAVWAAHCPVNFEHLRLMMEAELASLDDRVRDAVDLYERAITAAADSGYRRDEAMANELAAAHLLRLGWTRAADGYLRTARYLYYRWGAARKVEQLEERHASLEPLEPATGTAGTLGTFTHTSTSDSLDSAALDMSSVMKASQAISGEIVLDQLWRTTMGILLENAGGQKGVFVVREGDQLLVRASSPPLAETTEARAALPLSIVNNVMRTQRPLVLEDATNSGRFASDPYIVASQPKSVLCVPIHRHGRFDGAIYIENNLTCGAFTVDRVEVIKLLAAQAAISTENARLYEEQRRLIEAQQRFVPSQFLDSLGRSDIADVSLGEYVAREMSVMFADFRDFTPLAERLGPRATIELLNRYFSRLGEPIADAGGFIDSYNGDEIMALFGVTADRAVAAGVAMWRALDELNRDSAAAGGPTLRMGIGINTGQLVLGTVGGHDRLKCGVVGDTVNLASRVGELTKTYRAPFLIGEHTFASLAAPDRLSLRKIDRVAVKGKLGAVDIYEVLDAESPDRRAAKEATRDRLAEAMALYNGREFAAAAERFRATAADDPDDAVLALFTERASRYAAAPPPDDWPGYESLRHK